MEIGMFYYKAFFLGRVFDCPHCGMSLALKKNRCLYIAKAGFFLLFLLSVVFFFDFNLSLVGSLVSLIWLVVSAFILKTGLENLIIESMGAE